MFRDDIEKLKALQDIDREIVRLKEQLNLYPPMLKRLEKNLDRKRKELQSIRDGQQERQKQRRLMEKEILFRQEEIQKKSAQQLAPKIKQDAFEALKREMDKLKGEINVLEDKIIQFIAEDEQALKALAEAETVFKREEEDAQVERKRIEDQIASKNRRITDLDSERTQQLTLVPKDLLTYYNRYYRGHGPTVVVPIEGDSCGGCHMRILPQVIVEAKQCEKMVTCEGCRRILITAE